MTVFLTLVGIWTICLVCDLVLLLWLNEALKQHRWRFRK